ncbi:T6SS effector BTH_I2691 family protein, partial [Providencia sp. PROV172]
MTEQNQSQGCNFCIRQGLPILLARPAIMSKQDILPVMPQSIHVPVEAQGETAYTLRLLRSGYLNIWDEIGNEWINYYITEGGFYYPLPPDGDVPDNVISGKIKPCIDQPEELAKASLVTLPVMPDGMKNGLFWFAWSEVKWTETIREQFEDKHHREQYMQPFDMDSWLKSQQADQSLPLEQLEYTVAEYHQHA